MAHPPGESNDEVLRLDFDRHLMAQFQGSVVTSDTATIQHLEAAEIVLAVRIVVRREGDEAVDTPHDLDLLLRRHGGNARGDVDAPVAGEASSERIVQLADSRCQIHTLLM